MLKILKNTVIVNLLLFLGLFLCSCSDNSSKNTENGKIVLKLGGWYTIQALDATQKKIDQYNKENPDVEVKVVAYSSATSYFQNLQGQIASKTAPDMLLLEPNIFQMLYKNHAIISLDEYIKKVGYKTGDIYKALLDGYMIDGKLYAIPSDFNMLALYYNKDMLDKTGLNVPETYEELRSTAKKLTTNNVYGLNINPLIGRIMPFIEAFGGEIISGSGNLQINTKGKAEGIKFIMDMYNKDKSAVTCKVLGDGWTGDTFGKQKAAMAVEGTWMIGYLRNNIKGFKWGIAPMPAEKGKAPQLMFSGAYAVPVCSKHPLEAVKFLKWYLAPENVFEGFLAGSQSIPVQKSYKSKVIKKFPELKELLDKTQNASMYSFGKAGKKFEDYINNILEILAYMPEKDSLKNIQNELDQVQSRFELQ